MYKIFVHRAKHGVFTPIGETPRQGNDPFYYD